MQFKISQFLEFNKNKITIFCSNSKTEIGASMVEYAMLLAMIAVVALVGVRLVGQKVSQQFSVTGSNL